MRRCFTFAFNLLLFVGLATSQTAKIPRTGNPDFSQATSDKQAEQKNDDLGYCISFQELIREKKPCKTSPCGLCDSVLGTCVDFKETRKCQQCESKPCEVTSCDGKYCVLRKGMLLDNDGGTSKSLVTRSCSAQVYDGCCMDKTNDGKLKSLYTSYTCSKTCDTDGCNSGDIDIAIASRRKPVKCVQCNDTNGCQSKREATWCSSVYDYCYGEMTYFTRINPITGQHEYKLVKLTKRCADKRDWRSGCKEKFIAERGLLKVTCSSTCTGTGCNDGWPGRLKCNKKKKCENPYEVCKGGKCSGASNLHFNSFLIFFIGLATFLE